MSKKSTQNTTATEQTDVASWDLFPDTLTRPVGRPKKYASAAERQKAYRARLKEQGKRVVSRVVPDRRDRSEPLKSDIIDLSEVRKKP